MIYYFYSFLYFLFSGAESSVAKLIVIKKDTTEEIQMDIARVLALTSGGGGAPYARTSFGNTCKDVLSYLFSPSDPVIHLCPFPSVLDSFFVTSTLFSFPPSRCSSEMIDGAVNQCIFASCVASTQRIYGRIYGRMQRIYAGTDRKFLNTTLWANSLPQCT